MAIVMPLNAVKLPAVFVRDVSRHQAGRLAFFGVAAVLVLALAAPPCAAQIGFTHYSLEWLVAASDVVVRATVNDFTVKQLGPHDRVATIVLVPKEVLKGKSGSRIELAAEFYGDDDLLVQWKKSGKEVLWFLSRSKDRRDVLAHHISMESVPYDLVPAEDVYTIELVPNIGKRVSRQPPPPIYKMDLTLLERPEDILRTARRAAQEGDSGKPARIHYIPISHELAERTGRAGDADNFALPVNTRLEEIARSWIKSPEAVVDRLKLGRTKEGKVDKKWVRFEQTSFRSEGAKALQYFKSDQNIDILRGLLDDPNWTSHTHDRGDGTMETTQVYDARLAAYKVLNKWGVKVDRPITTK